MRELTFNEVDVVSGARPMTGGYYGRRTSNFSMSNGGNWGNTWTQTGIWAMSGLAAGSRGGIWGGAIGFGAGALGGFFGSFTYSW